MHLKNRSWLAFGSCLSIHRLWLPWRGVGGFAVSRVNYLSSGCIVSQHTFHVVSTGVAGSADPLIRASASALFGLLLSPSIFFIQCLKRSVGISSIVHSLPRPMLAHPLSISGMQPGLYRSKHYCRIDVECFLPQWFTYSLASQKQITALLEVVSLRPTSSDTLSRSSALVRGIGQHFLS